MILYTGNPFVDVGLAIAANIGNQAPLSNISFDDLSKAVKFLHSHVDSLKSLKILSESWVNNPFMGINTEQKWKSDRILEELSDQTLASGSGYCQFCAQSPVVGEP